MVDKKWIAAALGFLNPGCVTTYLTKGPGLFIAAIALNIAFTYLLGLAGILIIAGIAAVYGFVEAEKMSEVHPLWTFWVWFIFCILVVGGTVVYEFMRVL
ncbi:MAG: hypothetical protein LUO91_03925 [Methanomicrobiales archaeon]|nr:hypothetical protein [Methanomicrobiales archaeon]